MLEALGNKPGTISTGKLVILLKMLGIDYIFDIPIFQQIWITIVKLFKT